MDKAPRQEDFATNHICGPKDYLYDRRLDIDKFD